MATAASGLAVAAPSAFADEPETLYGVTSVMGAETLVTFSSSDPSVVTTVGPIGGLNDVTAEKIVSLDFRAANGQLYALTTDDEINVISGLTTAAPTATPQVYGGAPLALTGAADIDFNPVADAIRVVGSVNENYRIALASSTVFKDTNLSQSGITGAAYTNPTASSQQTTLYDVGGDTEFRQGSPGGTPNSPNGGVLTAIGDLDPSFDEDSDGGFDISPNTGIGYLLRDDAGTPTVLTVDVANAVETTEGPTVAGLHAIAVAPTTAALSFTSATAAVAEDGGSVVLTVRRVGNINATPSFNYTLTPETASAADYGTPTPAGPISFAAGETTKTITFPIVNDGTPEADETFLVALSGNTGASLGTPSSSRVTIFDDGTPYTATEAERVYGVDGANNLVSFLTTTPGTTTASTPIAPVDGTVLGIDIQPSTGRLFAVTSASKVYTVNKTTGAATQVGTTAFTPAATGTSFGVDFNPVPNAIRFLSSGGAANQSLRISPATGQVVAMGVDTAPAGTIAAAAYTNSVNGANSSTLYAIDSAADTLVRIGGQGGSPSPNGGQTTTVGSLAANLNGDTGFDISGATNVAYVSAQVTADQATFHKIDLSNGRVSTGVPIGNGTVDLIDIAVDAQPPSVQFSAAATSVKESGGPATVTVTRTGNTDNASSVMVETTATGTATTGSDYTAVPATTLTFDPGQTTKTVDVPIVDDDDVEASETIGLRLFTTTGASLGAPNTATITIIDDDKAAGAPTPEPAFEAERIYGVDGAGNLVSFLSTTPETTTTTPISGVDGAIAGIDIQPRTGRLFAVSTSSKVYTLNKSTGAATQVGTAAFTPAAAAGPYGVDFNPVPNAIRFLATGQSLRLSPDTGAALGTDTPPAGVTVAGAAYTNSVNGANSTTLYVLDSADDTLKRIGGLGGSPSPNAGAVTPVGPIGADIDGDTGFDISGATNVAYASVQATANSATLHRIDLASGQASVGAAIGNGAVDLIDIAVDAQPPSVQFSAAATSVKESAGNAVVTVTRTGNTDGASTVSVATTTTGTATAGSDYTAVPATVLSFAAGETSKTVNVPIIDDSSVEDSETIGVALSGPSGTSLGAPNAATITVFDNDPTTVTNNVPGPTTTVPGPTVIVQVPERADQVLLVAAPNQLSLASVRRNGIRIQNSCAEACTVSYTLQLGARVLGTTQSVLPGRGVASANVALTKAGTRILRRALRPRKVKSRTIVLRGSATDSDGGAASTGSARISVRG